VGVEKKMEGVGTRMIMMILHEISTVFKKKKKETVNNPSKGRHLFFSFSGPYSNGQNTAGRNRLQDAVPLSLN
jgi:hypothetical protein